MLFTLEALPARYGDALLLHFGEATNPKLIVIDGGTATVYQRSLRPRLEQLLAAHHARTGEDPDPLALPTDVNPLPVELVMISHLDDDHIRGILDWTQELVTRRKNSQPLSYAIREFWHNSFDDVIGNAERTQTLLEQLGDGITPASAGSDFHVDPALEEFRSGALVLASVAQGRELRKNIVALGADLNQRGSTGPLIQAPAEGQKVVEFPGGLKMTILGPLDSEIQALEEEWDEQLPRILAREGRDRQAQAAEFADRSVFNLSSIVVLTELEGRRMLLTGDARGDLILNGLAAAGLLDDAGKFHVDLLKLPHHGSIHNVNRSFFERITADHYVISSDGDRFQNPDLETLDLLSEVRGDQPFTLHLTYPKAQRSEGQATTDGFAPSFAFEETIALFEHDRAAGLKYQVQFRNVSAASIKVDLGAEPLTF